MGRSYPLSRKFINLPESYSNFPELDPTKHLWDLERYQFDNKNFDTHLYPNGVFTLQEMSVIGQNWDILWKHFYNIMNYINRKYYVGYDLEKILPQLNINQMAYILNIVIQEFTTRKIDIIKKLKEYKPEVIIKDILKSLDNFNVDYMLVDSNIVYSKYLSKDELDIINTANKMNKSKKQHTNNYINNDNIEFIVIGFVIGLVLFFPFYISVPLAFLSVYISSLIYKKYNKKQENNSNEIELRNE